MFYADHRGKLPKSLNLYLIGDTHIGNIALAEKSLKKAIGIIKADKRARFGFMGDATDSVHIEDKRYALVVAKGKFATANKQAKKTASLFEPIKKKCLFWLEGNHEETLGDKVNISEMIIDRLDIDIPYGGRSCKCLLMENIFLWATHGNGAVNSTAGDYDNIVRNDARRVKRKLRWLQGDCVLMAMGHVHKMRVCYPPKRLMIIGATQAKQVYTEPSYDVKKGIPEEDRYYMSCGAFLRTQIEGDTTYSEKAGYPPVEMGMIKVSISGERVVSVEKVFV